MKVYEEKLRLENSNESINAVLANGGVLKAVEVCVEKGKLEEAFEIASIGRAGGGE